MTNDYEHLLISLAFIIWQRKPGACLHSPQCLGPGWTRSTLIESRACQREANWRKHSIVTSVMVCSTFDHRNGGAGGGGGGVGFQATGHPAE